MPSPPFLPRASEFGLHRPMSLLQQVAAETGMYTCTVLSAGCTPPFISLISRSHRKPTKGISVTSFHLSSPEIPHPRGIISEAGRLEFASTVAVSELNNPPKKVFFLSNTGTSIRFQRSKTVWNPQRWFLPLKLKTVRNPQRSFYLSS